MEDDSNLFFSGKETSVDQAFRKVCLEHPKLRTDSVPRNNQPELAKLKQPDIFKTGVFLVGKHHPSEKTLAFLQDYFGTNISRGHCFVSNSAHLQPDGFAEKGDVALLKAAEGDTGPWGACQVWLHVEVDGHAPMSLISLYNFVRYDQDLYSATWDVKVAPAFVYTSDVLSSTTYRKSAGQVITLIPLAHR